MEGGESAEGGGGAEEQMEEAAPEQAAADAAAEAEDDPDAQSEGGAGGAAEAASGGAGEPAAESANAPSDAAESDGGQSDTATSTPAAPATQSAPPAVDVAEPPPPAAAPASEPATESAETAAAGEGGLEPAESQAALASISAGGGAEPSGGGGGGGGGGGAAEETAPPVVPDVSGQPPETALASIGNLPPVQLASALGGVSAAVGQDVNGQRSELAANPPEMERPSGSPVTKSGPTNAAPAAPGTAQKVPKTPSGQEVPTPAPVPLAPPPPAVTNAVRAPAIAPAGDAPLTENDAQRVRASVQNMPTSDPGLNETAGPPPAVSLSGDADPEQAQAQRTELAATMTAATDEGRRDVAQPMGEDQIYPTVQPETLRAQPPAGGGAAGAAPSAPAISGGDSDEAVSIIAEKQSGPEIQAAVGKAQGEVAARRQEHTEAVAEERAKNQEQITALESENAAEQSTERAKGSAEVQQARGEWSEAQQAEAGKANEEADGKVAETNEQITQEETTANEEAAGHIEEGETEATGHRDQAEADASQKRAEAEQESDGVLGWIASKAKAFFDRVKKGITAVFDAARKLVRAAIEKAKKLAVAAIERARQAVVGLIKAVGAALIAIGDHLLAAFPGLRDRFRRFIQEKVDAAEAAVNRLAEALKKGVQKLLDLLGAALDAALGLLEKGMLAAVDAANAVVQGAIKAAQAVADALGAFLALVKDVSSDPLGWIGKLGAAVVDGIRNHLWKALKTAIKNWFNSKLEEVLGIGGMIWGVLKKGGIAIGEVGKMAWEGLKAAIPVALITILVEKLVAMIVPAAGAVIAIIEGLQAAWGTVSRIIAAFGKFFAFLKAVKSGSAGPQFADAVAAAAVVVIDFVANWLLKKLRGPAGKIGGKIKAIAKKIMARLKRVASKVGKALKKAGAKVLGKLKGLGKKLKDWRNKRRKKKEKKDPNKKQQDKEKAKRERLQKAIREIQPQVERMLGRGVGKLALQAKLLYWRVRYRLRVLRLAGSQIVAANSPEEVIASVAPAALGQALEPILRAAEKAYLRRYEESRMMEDVARDMGLPPDAAAGGKNFMPQRAEVDDLITQRNIQAGASGVLPGQSVPLRSTGGSVTFPQPRGGVPAGKGMIVSPSMNYSYEGGQARFLRPPSLAQGVVPAGPYASYQALEDFWKTQGGAPPIGGLGKGVQSIALLERARGEGLLPAMDVAHSLAKHGVGGTTTEDVITGPLNPHRPQMSGVASDREAKGGGPDPFRSPGEERQIERARTERHASIGQIFLRLRQVLQSPSHDILSKPGGSELVALAQSFNRWLQAHLSENPSPATLKRLSQMLMRELVLFLKTFRG